MLIIRSYVNMKEVGVLGVLNTGSINKDGEHLYRVVYPDKDRERYGRLKIAHTRSEGWKVLTEKVLHAINKEK